MPAQPTDPLTRFEIALNDSLRDGTLIKLTLGKPRPTAADATLHNVFVRPVSLQSGPHLCLVFRHATRDITKNLSPAEAIPTLRRLLAEDFLDAHLFTPLQTAQLEQSADGAKPARLRLKAVAPLASTPFATTPPPAAAHHDREKHHVLAADAPWLRALGVTNERGQPREGMAHKFRQIEKFAELLCTLLAEAGLSPLNDARIHANPAAAGSPLFPPLRIADMGAGKGYLTFALAALLGPRAQITGIERRADLVAAGNRVANEVGFASHLRFIQGDIPTGNALGTAPGGDSGVQAHDRPIGAAPRTGPQTGPLDVLIALHACDTATDDALFAGHLAGARLLVVSPCCQKEIRRQLAAPAVLAGALRHGIFQERQAEFVTDALRAQLLECVGYRTKVFEFISTEHTAKNLMIAALRPSPAANPPATHAVTDPKATARARDLAAFYGVTEQRLAYHLRLPLVEAK